MNKKLLYISWISIKVLLLQCLYMLYAKPDYDYLLFVQQWPGASCYTSFETSCCEAVPSNFSIHGLRPVLINGVYPTYCGHNNPYNISEMSDLESRLKNEWPSFNCTGTHDMFWSSEWDKHGTCSASVLDQHAYFSSALTLKSKIDILKILNRSGINPNGDIYSLSSIVSSISNATNNRIPFVKCNEDMYGEKQLYQIHSCVDAYGLNFIDCPAGLPEGGCSANDSIFFVQF